MKKILLFVLIICSNLFAQNEFQSFLSRVNSISDHMKKTEVVDSFMNYARIKGIPFIENNTANFMYNGNATTNSVRIAGDFNGWDPDLILTKLSGTNFYYASKDFELTARLDYKLVVNGNWILDPENPNRVSGGFGPNSELAMPDYVQPWEIKVRPNVKIGKTETKTIYSDSIRRNYQVTIYLPPDYDSTSGNYPTVYFQDGTEYITLGSSKIVIDNLLDSNKIEPLIAVFVKPTDRSDEYAFSNRNKYRMFFVNELVPFIDSVYKTEKDPNRRLVLGDSFGGNISTLVAYNHPDVFANVGIHSGAFQPNDYEANILFTGEYKPIKIYTLWGSYESYLTKNWRDNISKLDDKGYEFKYKEYFEGHSWGLWRATTDDILKYFFPTKNPTSVDEISKVTEFRLDQNYPNPFNPTTAINYQLSEISKVELKVFDILGKEISTLVNEIQNAGIYKVIFDASNLPSGIYFYKIQTDKFSETKKMIFIK